MAKWKIYDIFYVSLLKYTIIKKEKVNKINNELEPKQEFKVRNDIKYKIKVIYNNKVYIKEIIS